MCTYNSADMQLPIISQCILVRMKLYLIEGIAEENWSENASLLILQQSMQR